MVFRYKDIYAFDNNKTMKKLFTVCTEQASSPYIEHAASGLPNPTRLEWGYNLSRLKTSRCYHTLSENGNRVFTHSFDVN